MEAIKKVHHYHRPVHTSPTNHTLRLLILSKIWLPLLLLANVTLAALPYGRQACRFGFPKPILLNTTLDVADDEQPVVTTARNDALLNAFNPMQHSAWRANVDMQYCVSRQKVITYCAKYATKCEPRSVPLKEIFTNIVRSLREDNSSLTAVQKLLISSVGERDYSAQETCHLLLQLPLFRASRDFVYLSLDGSRSVVTHLQTGQPATASSILDHYRARPANPPYKNMTLLHFAQQYSMPKDPASQPAVRSKKVVIIVRPYYSPEPDSPNYEQYCQQKLMLHKLFRDISQLKDCWDTFTEAYAEFFRVKMFPHHSPIIGG